VAAETITVKLWVALIAGEPLSVTLTEKALVEFASEISGRHASTPLVELRAALVGEVSRLNVSVCAGESESVATFVIESEVPGVMVRSETAASVGAVLLTTVTLKVAAELFVNPPVLMTLTKYEPALFVVTDAMA
jgi:hypothetical protein